MIIEGGSHKVSKRLDTSSITLKGDVTLLLDIPKGNNDTLDVFCESESRVTLILTFEQSSTIKNRIHIGRNAEVIVSVIHVEPQQTEHDMTLVLDAPGGVCHLFGALYVESSLKWHVHADHQAHQTEAYLEIKGIVGAQGTLDCEVCGDIKKGHYGSKTHQNTKIVSLGSHESIRVFPKLLISEYDVEASHAASVGSVDEASVLYLMMRGISRNDAVQLLLSHYLMPMCSHIKDDAIQSIVKTKLETKVNNHGK